MPRKTPYNELLVKNREAQGLTMRQMASKAAVDPAMISRVEKASRGVNIINAVKIARAYDVPLEPFILYVASLQGFEG